MKTIKDIKQVVGENIKEARLRGDLTLEDVATECRRLGFAFAASRVADAESGKMGVSIPNVLLFSVALTNLLRPYTSITLGDLLRTDDDTVVDIYKGVTIDGEKLSNWAQSDIDVILNVPGNSSVKVNARETDRNMANRLGVSTAEYRRLAIKKWGRTLAEERDARAPEGAVAQAKGIITRALVKELMS